MNIRTIIILRHFLGELEKRCEQEQLSEPMHPAFIHLLKREELIDILVRMYGGGEELKQAHPNYETEANSILLFDYIRDEYYILEYFNAVVFEQYVM